MRGGLSQNQVYLFIFWQKLFKQQEVNLSEPTARVYMFKSMAHFQLSTAQPVCGTAGQYDLKNNTVMFSFLMKYNIYLQVFFWTGFRDVFIRKNNYGLSSL